MMFVRCTKDYPQQQKLITGRQNTVSLILYNTEENSGILRLFVGHSAVFRPLPDAIKMIFNELLRLSIKFKDEKMKQNLTWVFQIRKKCDIVVFRGLLVIFDNKKC